MFPPFTLTQLTAHLNITLQGDPDCLIHQVATIQEASPGSITFLVNPAYKKYLSTTKASAVILLPEDAKSCTTNAIICSDPYYIYSQIAAFFHDKPLSSPGIHPTAIIGKNCQIDSSVSIGPYCVIADKVTIAAHVVIGAGCIIDNHCTLDEYTTLAAHVTLYDHVK